MIFFFVLLSTLISLLSFPIDLRFKVYIYTPNDIIITIIIPKIFTAFIIITIDIVIIISIVSVYSFYFSLLLLLSLLLWPHLYYR